MRHIRNERGATLVLTVMVITILLMFILLLLTQVTNTNKQVSKMEIRHDARLLADMGVDYVHSMLDQFQGTDGESLKKYISENIPTKPVVMDGKRSFTVEFAEIPALEKSTTIQYKSIGTSGETKDTVEDSILIQFEGE